MGEMDVVKIENPGRLGLVGAGGRPIDDGLQRDVG
jgi:hypothetical protein